MYSKIKPYLPSDHLIGKVSLFLSVMAMFFAVSSGNTGCLYAEECSVGDSESFSNNIPPILAVNELHMTGFLG